MPHRLSLREMTAKIQERKLSPVELVEAHLRQIERLNPKLNAFVILLAEQARAAAREAENRQMHGERLGPLDGIPVTVKDSFDMAGLKTHCGSKFLGTSPAAADAVSVARLRAAGAVILGKTNCPEFLASYETDNFITGRTNNAWDVERTPGGSSGGEATAISAFCSAGGIGSDGGGSIRVPAHFSGIAGLKPTPGRCPASGHVPTISHPGGLLGVGGPMARDVDAVRMLFEVLAGADDGDPFSAPVPVRRVTAKGIRIGLMEQFYRVPVQAAIKTAVRKAGETLAALGFPVEPFEPVGIERAPNLWWLFFGILPAPFTKDLIAGREDEVHFTGIEFFRQAIEEPQPTAKELVEALARRDRLRGSLLRQMRDVPVLLLPVCGTTAFRHRQRRYATPEKEISLFEAMMPLTPFNLFGMPGLAVPFGLDESGLPVGVQLVAKPWDEELLLEIGAQLEAARGPFPAPPGV